VPSTSVAAREPDETHSEAYRVLRSNLNVVLSELERPTVVVTSAYAGEGKTATCVNLARAMVLSGQRVILVDMDLRHPDAHRWLGGHNEYGVSDVLLEQRPLDDSLQYVEIGKGPSDNPRPLYLLAAGKGVSNPAELLGTARAARMLEALARQSDVVLIDTPPVLPVADTLVIGRMVAGAVLVVETRRTPIGAVEQSKAALIRNQARLLGLVVNKLQPRDADFGYGYGYGYGYPSTNGE
jgi:capsular exopolysaccharide synthesis family protein